MIRIVQGDITTLAVDAVVNAATQRILGGREGFQTYTGENDEH